MKLTEAQRRELIYMAEKGTKAHYSDSYMTIQKLLSLGLIKREDARYGGGLYSITEAGRALLDTEGSR